MNQQAASPSTAWVGWTIVGLFVALLAFVGITGHGLGEALHPAAPSEHIQLGRAPVSAQPVGSVAWIEAEFHRMKILAADEQLVPRQAAAPPHCYPIVAGPAGEFRGWVCQSDQGLYRVNADGSESPVHLHYDLGGNWFVIVRQA